MLLNILRVELLFSLICFCNISKCQVILKGNIHGANGARVMLFEPINDFSNSILAKPEWEIIPDKNGDFNTEIGLSSPNMLVLQIGLEPIWIFAEPRDTIDVSINLNKFTNESPNGGLLFKGRNAKGNEYFNYFNYQPSRKLANFKNIVDDSLNFHKNLDLNSLEIGSKLILAHFDTLLKSGQITRTFYDGVVPGIQANLLSTEFRYFLVEQPKKEFMENVLISRKILERFSVNLTNLKSSIFISSIGYWVSKIKEYEYYKEKIGKDSVINYDGHKLFINKNLKNWLFLPKGVQEILWPLNLLVLKEMFADSYSQRDVDAYLTLFPKSPLRFYLKPPYFGNITATNYADSAMIHIMQDSSHVSFIDFLKSNFGGKKIYIDFWASWCAPCKFEFKFNPELDSFFNKNNITRLYVSFDQPELHDNMIKSIYAYNLKGYHFQVNQTIYKDIIRLFYPEGQFSIPRYLIVNKNSEILNSDAPRPSDKVELFKKIKSAFEINDD